MGDEIVSGIKRSLVFVIIAGELGLMIPCGFWYYHANRQGATVGLKSRTPSTFQGIIIDQEGSPISKAEIVVQISTMVDNPIIAGGALPDRLPQNRFSVYSGVEGVFDITLQPPNHVLEIQDIKKEGYTWLTDWLWTVPSDVYQELQTRWFDLGGPRASSPVYIPDISNPPIFVLVKDGYHGQVTTMPSRGGSDQLRDGTTVINHPKPVAIPSTGPGAPQGHDAIGEAIRRYVDRRNAASTQPESDK